MAFLAAIPWGVYAVMAAVAVAGKVVEAKDKSDAANYNAAIARISAGKKENRVRTDYRRLEGRQRVGYGANNVAMSGSALDVLADQAMEEEKDALHARAGGKVETSQYKDFASQAKVSAGFNVVSTILSSYTRFNMAGAGGGAAGGGAAGG